MKPLYAFHIPHGSLFLFGENLEHCKPYIDSSVNSVEEVCVYCNKHNLRVHYQPKHIVCSLFESFRVHRLTKKYSVFASWSELNHYLQIYL